MNAKPFNQEQRDSEVSESQQRWGTWDDAEYWRKQSFLRRTPAQRLQWLEEMLDLSRIGKALSIRER